MLRFLSYGFFRNVSKYLRQKNVNVTSPKAFCSVASKLVMSSQICCTALKTDGRTKIDVENGLTTACQEGDDAIILLMDNLKEFVIVVSREYRNCLIKQIEIIQSASNLGPLSEIWDELPQYRTLADELNKELIDYMTVFNIIGQMTSDDSLVSFVTTSTEKFDLIVSKYKKLNIILQEEFAKNREIELQLLRINCDSILKGVN